MLTAASRTCSAQSKAAVHTLLLQQHLHALHVSRLPSRRFHGSRFGTCGVANLQQMEVSILPRESVSAGSRQHCDFSSVLAVLSAERRLRWSLSLHGAKQRISERPLFKDNHFVRVSTDTESSERCESHVNNRPNGMLTDGVSTSTPTRTKRGPNKIRFANQSTPLSMDFFIVGATDACGTVCASANQRQG